MDVKHIKSMECGSERSSETSERDSVAAQTNGRASDRKKRARSSRSPVFSVPVLSSENADGGEVGKRSRKLDSGSLKTPRRSNSEHNAFGVSDRRDCGGGNVRIGASKRANKRAFSVGSERRRRRSSNDRSWLDSLISDVSNFSFNSPTSDSDSHSSRVRCNPPTPEHDYDASPKMVDSAIPVVSQSGGVFGDATVTNTNYSISGVGGCTIGPLVKGSTKEATSNPVGVTDTLVDSMMHSLAENGVIDVVIRSMVGDTTRRVDECDGSNVDSIERVGTIGTVGTVVDGSSGMSGVGTAAVPPSNCSSGMHNGVVRVYDLADEELHVSDNIEALAFATLSELDAIVSEPLPTSPEFEMLLSSLNELDESLTTGTGSPTVKVPTSVVEESTYDPYKTVVDQFFSDELLALFDPEYERREMTHDSQPPVLSPQLGQTAIANGTEAALPTLTSVQTQPEFFYDFSSLTALQ